MDPARALDVLSTLLVGQSLGSICVGDWWSLHLLSDPHLVLLAQEVTCPDGPQIAGSLSRIARSPMDGVDSSDIPAAVAILRNRRRAITGVTVAQDGTLTLSFDQGWALRLTTSTVEVDWQWALSREDSDPYRGSLVACFRPGEVSVSDEGTISDNLPSN